MNEILKLVLSLSLSGSILALMMFLIKPFIRNKVSKMVQYYLWIVVVVRLVLPFSFEGSVMNNIFYKDQPPGVPRTESTGWSMELGSSGIVNSISLPNVERNVATGIYGYDPDHSRYLNDLFNQYLIYIWIFGAIVAFSANIIGFASFSIGLKGGNKPATHGENIMLLSLLKSNRKVNLLRNRFVTTPMLIGLITPCIIIPDIDFDEKKLKNILLHEISHLRRYDIGLKWITMIATSIHWFNPLMFFIKREINNACELACDESVIKNLSPKEKQDYGDTLISVVSEQKYPHGVMQATMCEEKRSLKERLIAIMNHNKKSRFIVGLSVFLMVFIISGAMYLGAGIGFVEGSRIDSVTSESFDLEQIAKHRTIYIGNHTKVGAIAGLLPVPNSNFKQRYISMKTSERPYGLTIYYELAQDRKYQGQWPIVTPNSDIEVNSRINALLVFTMIDNADEVTFAFRNSQSKGELEQSQYDTSFTFQRADFEEQYGNLSVLGKDLKALEAILRGQKTDFLGVGDVPLMPEFTEDEVSSARGVVEKYFRAIAAKDDAAILAALYPREHYTMEGVRSGYVQLYGTEKRTLLSIDYNAQDDMRYRYSDNHNLPKENVIVFKVSFEIKYPLNDGGPWNEGIYNNWSIILIRDDRNSPWFIYDQGY